MLDEQANFFQQVHCHTPVIKALGRLKQKQIWLTSGQLTETLSRNKKARNVAEQEDPAFNPSHCMCVHTHTQIPILESELRQEKR